MMTEQQELNTLKAIPTAFDRVRDLAHRGQAIRELMAKEDCDSLVKELLEREQARNDKMAYEALQDAIREQHNKPWQPPAGYSFRSILRTGPTLVEIVNNVPKVVTDVKLTIGGVKVDLSGLQAPAFKQSPGTVMIKELEKLDKETALAANICEDCQDFENCFPHGKKEQVSPELAKVMDRVIGELEAIFGDEEDHPECVTIPPHLMERVEKLMAWSSHDAQEITNFALSQYLEKLGY
ncbi:MAG: hypothetical protein ACRCXB_22910 [Aeromonadaceae bacterium]